jgi:MmyB-like transcription regulator ligand binding domain
MCHAAAVRSCSVRFFGAVLSTHPGVPARWQSPGLDLATPLVPVVPISFQHRGRSFHFFSAVTVLGTPQDVTLQELRIEWFFPLDEATAASVKI